ncbi:uncharacterized protein DS421_6g192800 [Arachis hypogaea]|nr:uncharacterized protein DS421_6g192800 [Arachis hypogaea]
MYSCPFILKFFGAQQITCFMSNLLHQNVKASRTDCDVNPFLNHIHYTSVNLYMTYSERATYFRFSGTSNYFTPLASYRFKVLTDQACNGIPKHSSHSLQVSLCSDSSIATLYETAVEGYSC